MISYIINIYDKHIYYNNKCKYIYLNDGALTQWRHYVNKRLYNLIVRIK